MIISIIGNGNMAKGLATRLLAGGHSVELHVRDMAKGEALQQELAGALSGVSRVTVVEHGSPVAGEVLIPAVHYGPEIEAVAETYAEYAAGKIVVDITNPVDFATFQLIPEPGKSGAEEVSRLFPQSTVVKAFNTVFSATLATGKAGEVAADVFVASDDEQAKQTVSGLVRDGGMRPLDAGPLANARHLEGIELIHMNLQEQVQGNWATSLNIIA